MSYVALGQTMPAGVVPTSAEVEAEIVENLPYRAELQAEYNQYKKYIDLAGSLKDLSVEDIEKAAIEWGKTAILAYAKDHNIPLSVAEAKAMVTSELDEFLAQQSGLPIERISDLKNLDGALKTMVVMGAATTLGVDPALVTVTVDALTDGKLDENDFRAIGGTAGSIAGAALCQSFGIPGPIGAYIGGQIGTFIGDTMGTFFCGGMSASDISAEAAKARAQAQADLLDIREKLQNLYDQKLEPEYWAAWDKLLLDVHRAWWLREMGVKQRFPMRWFGRSKSWYTTYQIPATCNLTPPVCFDPKKFSPYAWEISTSCRQNCASASGCTANFCPEVCTTKCAYKCGKDYGCPYPTFPSLGAGELDRAAQVLAAQGAIYKAPQYRSHLVLPAPTTDEVNRTAGTRNANERELYGTGPYQKRLQGILLRATDFGGPKAAGFVVMGDLAKTATYVDVEHQLMRTIQQKNTRILAERFGIARRARTYEVLSNALKAAVLVGGVGTLGIVTYKSFFR